MFLASKVAFSWPSVDRIGKIFWGLMTLGQVEVYKISANLVHSELRNSQHNTTLNLEPQSGSLAMCTIVEHLGGVRVMGGSKPEHSKAFYPDETRI